MKKLSMLVTVLAVVALLAVGCTLPGVAPSNGGQPASPAATSGMGFGGIEVRVTDAPKYGVESVVVSFSRVSVHRAGEGEEPEEEETPTPTPTATATPTATPSATPTPSTSAGGGWIDIPVEDGSFDLVQLGKEGIDALLAQDDYVPAGKYTQIRVIIDENNPVKVTYTDPDNVDDGGEPILTTVDAKLPSGELKFVHPFEVVDGTTTIITLDFIVEDSVVFTGAGNNDKGNGAQVILKPVVKLSVERETLLGAVSGTVTDSSNDEPVDGAAVVVGGTSLSATADADGNYTIANVPVGAGTATYTVIASAEGYDSASVEDVGVSADTTTTVDFELNPEASP